MSFLFHGSSSGQAETDQLKMPILAAGGASSFFAAIADELLPEVATNVRVETIPRCGHWIFWR